MCGRIIQSGEFSKWRAGQTVVSSTGLLHSVQQIFEPSQAANLSDESQQFVETVESTNCFDRLGHRFHLLDSNGVCRFFNWGRWFRGGGGLLLWPEFVTAFRTGFCSGAFKPRITFWALFLAQS